MLGDSWEAIHPKKATRNVGRNLNSQEKCQEMDIIVTKRTVPKRLAEERRVCQVRCPRKSFTLTCEAFLAMAADMVRIQMEFWATKERFRIMEEVRGRTSGGCRCPRKFNDVVLGTRTRQKAILYAAYILYV